MRASLRTWLGLAASLAVGPACDDAPKTQAPPAEPITEGTAAPAPSDLSLPPPVAAKPEAHFEHRGDLQTTITSKGEGPYRFTTPWHLNKIPTWKKLFASSVGKPGLRYLEVGVFEGRSLLWMADNVLTDPSTRMVAVDIFMDEYEANFDHNVSVSPAKDRIRKIKGPSALVLADSELGKFDIIYIDGSHTADDVLADAVLAWQHLAPGGIIVFDDYEWTGRGKDAAPLPAELLPRLAVDAFLAAYRYELEILHRGFQIAIRRVENPCTPKDYCSPVAQYQYYWRAYELRRADGTVVELTDAERGLIEAIARSRVMGTFDFQIPPSVRGHATFEKLAKGLELSL